MIDNSLMTDLVAYAPADHPSPTQWVNMVNKMVLGTDKRGNERPIEDLYYFLQVSKRVGLDPTIKQLYAVYRWNTNAGKEIMAIQTGIDGLRSVAERTGSYGGSSDAEFEYGKDQTRPTKATITVFKIVGDKTFKVSASARWDEYYPGEKLGTMWRKMPHVMLSKVAEALALRKAFPVVSGIYLKEEMDQADDVSPVVVARAGKRTKKLNINKIAKQLEKGAKSGD